MKIERLPDKITNKDIEKAYRHAKSEYPKECCGVFTKSFGYVPCTNIHKNPKESFQMKEYRQVAANFDDVIAIFHSHPNGRAEPSSEDMKYQISTNKPWGIACLNDKKDIIDCFFWGSNNIPPLIGRKYRSGAMDCYSIIRDSYKLWYNISLPEFPRDKEFWKRGENKYTDGFSIAGFYKINSSDLKAGDVILGSIMSKGIINHGAIVLNEKEILHHLQGKISRRDSLSRWFKHLNVCIRHDEFKNIGGPPKPLGVDKRNEQ